MINATHPSTLSTSLYCLIILFNVMLFRNIGAKVTYLIDNYQQRNKNCVKTHSTFGDLVINEKQDRDWVLCPE